jgi:transposase
MPMSIAGGPRLDEVIEWGRKIPEVAGQLGIRSPETLRRFRQFEVDRGLKTGPTTGELAEIKAFREEVADQQRTIEILKAGPGVTSRASRRR